MALNANILHKGMPIIGSTWKVSVVFMKKAKFFCEMNC